jgi:hypothetical protein
MTLETFFKLTSYAVVACGLLSLYASGGVGLPQTLGFLVVMVLAWFLENTKWQISEKLGLILIFVLIPLFYLDWKYNFSGFSREQVGAATLSRLILALSAIKLLQSKSDRDWVFLYLISFFEILLSAGLSISPSFLLSLGLYLFFAACTVVAFEIRKTSRSVESQKNKQIVIGAFRLPNLTVMLLFFILTLAIPLFLVMPRTNGANFGGKLGGLSGFVGFSDSVRLGKIGQLQQSDQVVMRVRVENDDKSLPSQSLRWRGVALDFFDKQGWRKTRTNVTEPVSLTDGFFRFGSVKNLSQLTTQTIYLEPLDTNFLFAMSKLVAIQGNFNILNKDTEGNVLINRIDPERITYKVYSNSSQPNSQDLREDNQPYTAFEKRYFQLPENMDARIGQLAQEIVTDAGVKNRYDKAKTIETYLKANYGYSLDLKATGEEPLADFLFNVREGHCEYFASAMVVMLRTQGIAARVVNGFLSSDYNEAADAYIVTQKQAHSWVEVYFPKEQVWVTFDPTPASVDASANSNNGFVGMITNSFSKYVAAMEMFWIQYVVSYDTQEQKTLAKSMKNNFAQYQSYFVNYINDLKAFILNWWQSLNGFRGTEAKFTAIWQTVLVVISAIITFISLWFLSKWLIALNLWKRLSFWKRTRKSSDKIIEFYQRMTKLLAKQGLSRSPSQTPLEFAYSVASPEALKITNAYNRVRFGEYQLNPDESAQIEDWLNNLEKETSGKEK